MTEYLAGIKGYWDKRFGGEGKIWGESPSRTAYYALELFRKDGAKKVLVPGSGYGRNTKLFSESGFEVTGVEISPVACDMARKFDPLSRLFNASVLEMPFKAEFFDAIFCFNVLHLFRETERKLFVQVCSDRLRDKGMMFFTVFSEKESAFGKGQEVEANTFESKPGRPAHYFTEADLKKHFDNFSIIETGIMEDPEDHGEEGPHTHYLRYIYVKKQPR
jgi:SAM-dependent methyltransferase